MGRVWKSTMVLLSTLAALVIIVHSAEEDYEAIEAQYDRRDLRPRMLDIESPRNYEQPWRTMELEPVTQGSTPHDLWMANSSGEPPSRRRPVRKRKRRPEMTSAEEIPIARNTFAEENVRPYFEVNADRNEDDMPKRRRKKQEHRPEGKEHRPEKEEHRPEREEHRPERWTLPEPDRPFRRRGHRRKRPTVENWPTFSEFNEFRPDETARETDGHVTIGPLRSIDDEYRNYNENDNIKPELTISEYNRQPLAEEIGLLISTAQDLNNVPSMFEQKNASKTRSLTDIREDNTSMRTVVDNISVSEISDEDNNPVFVPNPNNDNNKDDTLTKGISKAGDYSRNIVKAQVTRNSETAGPIDPVSLKDILKKSNGTSLSEILQQNNLTLTDLLHGKEEVLSVLNSDDLQLANDSAENISFNSELTTEVKESNEEKVLPKSEIKDTAVKANDVLSTTYQTTIEDFVTEINGVQSISEKPKAEEASQRPNIRKFPTASRRKQRIRPMMNTTYKSQLSRDMIALNARKYFNNRRKNHEWKDHVPMMKKNISVEGASKKVEVETTTTNDLIDETTLQEVDNCTKTTESESEQNKGSENLDDIEVIYDRQKSLDSLPKSNIIPLVVNVSEKVIVATTTLPPPLTPVNSSTLRRQAFNNRLKKKRMKQKNLTTESPQDDIIMDLFGMPNLVSSSEFIAQTVRPKATRTEKIPTANLDDVTILEDYMTTEMSHRHENKKKSTKNSIPRKSTTPHGVFPTVATEESAKMEIEEIFNDTQTSKKLARILKERNMTLSELVEHRERGSSHVHLADIFHNTSKEPNPPEPFLSKSLIEPISKETYPLRALLDANNHDTTAKPPTTDPVTLQTEVNIPGIMNFGNNVNENAENMGIMSLFHNITRNETINNIKPTLKTDSQGTLYETSITVVNTTDGHQENNTVRESRVLHVINDNQDDIVSWNEIFSLMRRNYENQTEELTKSHPKGIIPAEKIKRPVLVEDLDGDGVIVLEDLQHLKDFDSNIASASNENLDFNSYQRAESTTARASSILDKIPSQTRSVTIATASIAGLAMVLFLLTYVGFRWHQHRIKTRKQSFSGERVPTPVFENRKSNKNNSSTRSISPMLTSNIYTLNTMDSRNGRESPDYMWDSLRKPFQ